MLTAQYATQKDLQYMINGSSDRMSVSLTTTKQELRSTVDHARDRIIERMQELAREQAYVMNILARQCEALARTTTLLETRVKDLERSFMHIHR